MPLLAKGAKDGNNLRYSRLASTELPVLMPVKMHPCSDIALA